MEVHHHAHHEGKKNWKSYFWEFLMLFIAVFCGFLAENLREHLVERHREGQYINSLLQDLKQDTVSLSENIKSRELRKFHASSLIKQLSFSINNDSLSKLYFSANKLTGLQVFNYSNSTLYQLKTSGLMRLIQNSNVVNSINSYDLSITRHKLREQVELEMTLEYNKAISTVLNAATVINLSDLSGIGIFNPRKGSSKMNLVYLPLLTKDPDQINLVKGLAALLYTRNLANHYHMIEYRKDVVNIIELIKKEYKIE